MNKDFNSTIDEKTGLTYKEMEQYWSENNKKLNSMIGDLGEILSERNRRIQKLQAAIEQIAKTECGFCSKHYIARMLLWEMGEM
jgi:ABC-type transporter Mla subunit MlaD